MKGLKGSDDSTSERIFDKLKTVSLKIR